MPQSRSSLFPLRLITLTSAPSTKPKMAVVGKRLVVFTSKDAIVRNLQYYSSGMVEGNIRKFHYFIVGFIEPKLGQGYGCLGMPRSVNLFHHATRSPH